ncbi:hypothetical protein [Shimia sp. NS0008-38b]|uniref:hypothetical protein n=1 Tax=Shimia sp. NS0008-38b TaxID=3127653 RepID=UPI00333EF07C
MYARSVDTLEELNGNLEWDRTEECSSPETITIKEVEGISSWAWKLRLENRLFERKNSVFEINRLAMAALRQYRNFAEALALYTCLCEAHGHRPETVFRLNGVAMRGAGLLNLSERKFLAARRTLENAGLIQQVQSHRAAKHGKGFCLLAPQRLIARSENNCAYLPARGL